MRLSTSCIAGMFTLLARICSLFADSHSESASAEGCVSSRAVTVSSKTALSVEIRFKEYGWSGDWVYNA